MLRQRSAMAFLFGLRMWLAVALLAIAAILLYTNLASAQQTSTEATLSAPALTAEAGEDSVELSWEAVTGAERYELYVWTRTGGWQRLDDGDLTGTTFRHPGLTAGTTYYYTVRAVHAGGVTGPWSEYASETFKPSMATPALTAEAGEGEVKLSWGVVQGAERYDLWVGTSADGWQQTGGDDLTGTTYRHVGLTAGTTYTYTMRAVNAENETSRWAEYVNATPQQDPQHTATATATPTTTPPDQQQNVPATATATATPTPTPTPTATATATPTATPTDDQLSQNFPATGAPTISGTARVCETLTVDVSNIADENGLENASYSVTWYAGEGYLRKTTADRFTYIVQSIDVGMTLIVAVIFQDDDGYFEHLETANTAVVVAAASPGKPRRAPAQVRVQPQGSGELSVSWFNPGSVWCGDGGSPITGFKVQWKEAADDWGTPGDVSQATVAIEADAFNVSYTIGGLTDGVEYAVRVIAKNAIGDGVASAAVNATPQDSATQ